MTVRPIPDCHGVWLLWLSHFYWLIFIASTSHLCASAFHLWHTLELVGQDFQHRIFLCSACVFAVASTKHRPALKTVIWFLLFVAWLLSTLCGNGYRIRIHRIPSSFLTRDPPVSDAHASTRRRVSNSGHSFGIDGARIRGRPYGLPIALRTSGIGDVAAFRSRPFRHLDRRSFHSFADSIYQHVRLCFHCSVGAHTVGQSCLADALSFRVGRTIIFRVDDSMIKSPNKSPNPRAFGAGRSARVRKAPWGHGPLRSSCTNRRRLSLLH
jgi:hypothetical protein